MEIVRQGLGFDILGGFTHQHLLVDTVVVVGVEVVAVQSCQFLVLRRDAARASNAMRWDAMRRTPRWGPCRAQP